MRRLLTAGFVGLSGLGVGLAVGVILMRRVEQAAEHMSPSSLAGRLSRVAGTARERVHAAVEETTRVARQREGELRREFDVPSVREATGLRSAPPARSAGMGAAPRAAGMGPGTQTARSATARPDGAGATE